MTIRLRPPNRSEAGALTELALRSKASWGYDAAFMHACVDALTISENDIADGLGRVAVGSEDRPLGMVFLIVNGARAHIEKLFVEPFSFGQGIGVKLFDWACQEAQVQGAEVVEIESDPGAEGFYLSQGAARIGKAPSEAIPGRMLPLLERSLS